MGFYNFYISANKNGFLDNTLMIAVPVQDAGGAADTYFLQKGEGVWVPGIRWSLESAENQVRKGLWARVLPYPLLFGNNSTQSAGKVCSGKCVKYVCMCMGECEFAHTH